MKETIRITKYSTIEKSITCPVCGKPITWTETTASVAGN